MGMFRAYARTYARDYGVIMLCLFPNFVFVLFVSSSYPRSRIIMSYMCIACASPFNQLPTTECVASVLSLKKGKVVVIIVDSCRVLCMHTRRHYTASQEYIFLAETKYVRTCTVEIPRLESGNETFFCAGIPRRLLQYSTGPQRANMTKKHDECSNNQTK